jgi:hypothetical protein
MSAGSATAFNATTSWSDLTKLAPIVWVEGARVGMEELRPVMDLYDNDQLDQFNRDYGNIADSGFGHVISENTDYITRVNNQGDTLSLTAVKRGDATTITEDLVDGNKYREIGQKLTDLGGSLFRTAARDATHVGYTFAFSASYTDMDGNTITNSIAKGAEPIYDDTHTMADASTFDNELADTAIGESALRSLQDLTTSFVDENGHKVSWKSGVKFLVHGNDPGMQHAALRLTTQEWNYNNTNRDINPYRGAFQDRELFYLDTTATGAIDSTKGKYYFIVSQNLLKRSAIMGWHTKPTPRGPFEDSWNGGMLYRSKSRYDIGYIFAQIGAGCPATT